MQFPRAFYQATRLGLGVILLLTVQIVGCGGGGGGGSTTTPATHQMGGARQGVVLNLRPTVSTLIGAAPGADGTGAAARFGERPAGIATDGANLYVSEPYTNRIRKVVIATGVVTTLAGTRERGAADGPGNAATFNMPLGLAINGGHLYVADYGNNKIRKIVIATGEVSSLTGAADTKVIAGAADGAGSTAAFNFPTDITTDGTNLYVADTDNHKIRKIDLAGGTVSSFTGKEHTAGEAGAADSANAAAATFNSPAGITSDGANLYVADSGNNKIRKIVIATGVVNSVTGTANTSVATGAADGSNTEAKFVDLQCITTDGSKLYVADYGNHKIRVIDIASGTVSSLTGLPDTASTYGAMDGAGATARFAYPRGITVVGGKLYVVDSLNNTVRMVELSTAAVSTLAGNAGGADGTGAAASLGGLTAYTTTDGTNLYMANGNRIRKIEIATGVVTTLAGTGVVGAADGAGSSATFAGATGITTDGTNVYVVDKGNNKIRQIVIATGVVSSLTGTAITAATGGLSDGEGATATFHNPTGITTDGVNLYVTDSGNNKIRKIVIATGFVSSLTGVANAVSTEGATDGQSTVAQFNNPTNITTDGSNLYVVDRGNNKIRKIVIASGEVSSLTGEAHTACATGAKDGAGTEARFNAPDGITSDGSNLYVADMYNNKIRKIEIATGMVSSLTGGADTPGAAGAADGAGASATFYWPVGITTDGSNLFVADKLNGEIRKIH